MAEVREGLSRGRSLKLSGLAVLAIAVAILCACQGNSVAGVADQNASNVELTFKVLGGPLSGQSSSSVAKSISRLILPAASTLTVSLTPIDSGLSAPSPKSAAISGTQSITLSFDGVDRGRYTVKAVASSAGGDAMFQQSADLDVSASTASATLMLVPVIGSGSPSYNSTNQNFSVGTIAPGGMIACEVPASVLPYGEYLLQFSMDSSYGFSFYIQDADGTLIDSGEYTTNGYIYDASHPSGATQIGISPPLQSISYLTIYNPNPGDASYITAGVWAFLP